MECTTRSGGTFKVLNRLSVTSVEGTCSICSKDKEVFPNPFITTLQSVKRNFPKCGCSPQYNYSPEQYSIICRRNSTDLTKFVGFTLTYDDGDLINSSHKLILHCTKHDIDWDTRNIREFLKNPSHCTLCESEYKSKRVSINWINETRLYNDVIQTIVAEDKKHVSYVCPICIKDPELYPPTFRLHKSDWRCGKNACGCSRSYRYSPEQYSLLCSRECKSRVDSTFMGIIPEYDGKVRYNSKIKVSCDIHDNHGVWDTCSIEKYLYRHAGCPVCARLNTYFGLYENRMGELDTLYLIRFKSKTDDESFIKIGRTFDIPERTSDFIKLYNIEILETIQDIHLLVYIRETSIHKTLTNYSYTPNIGFGGSVRECYLEKVLDNSLVKNTFKFTQQAL